MNLYAENQSGLDIIQDYSGLFAKFTGDVGGCSTGYLSSESMPAIPQSLVLDTEKGELVKASGRAGKKSDRTETKSVAALKSHSEAERRRRERINAHLAALRDLVPSNEKMDKATLLAEVINQVKQLKKTAGQLSDNYFVPLDFDEVRVERNDENGEKEGGGGGTNSFKAIICCEYRPGLLSDIRQALDTLEVNLVRSEISTLEGRVKNVFFFTVKNASESGVHLMNSVHQALSTIMENAAASAAEYSPRMMFPSKKRKVPYFDSTSSSS